jgi:hypothetical protein
MQKRTNKLHLTLAILLFALLAGHPIVAHAQKQSNIFSDYLNVLKAESTAPSISAASLICGSIDIVLQEG